MVEGIDIQVAAASTRLSSKKAALAVLPACARLHALRDFDGSAVVTSPSSCSSLFSWSPPS